MSEQPYPWDVLSGAQMWVPDGHAIRALDPPTIIEGMLRQGEVVTVIGGAKTNKTWFSMAMACAVASGNQFIGKEVTQAPVCYLDFELKLNMFRKRLSIVAPSPPESFDFQCLRGKQRLPKIQELETLIINNKYKLLVIDSLYCTSWVSEENSNDHTSKDLRALQEIAETTDVAIVVVDHTAKGSGKDRAVVDAARGASAKAGFFDSMFLLRQKEKAPEGQQQVTVDMVLRDWPSPKGTPILNFDFSGYQLKIEVVGEAAKGDQNGYRQKILDTLNDAKSAGVSYRELEDDFEIAESNARRILNKMLKENLVEEFKKPGEHAQRKFFRLKEVL